MKILKTKTAIIFLISAMLGMIISGCGGNEKEKTDESTDKFSILVEYIETSGDFINSEEAPAAVGADEVMNNMEKNIHIIDIRSAEDFSAGHIAGAVNVPFKDLVEYFESSIVPTTFENIYLFSSDGQAAFFASGILHLLGYSNVKPVRYGMCAWDKGFAEQYWLKHISSKFSDKITTEPSSMAPSGSYPNITSDFENGYDILRERAIQLLQQPYKDFVAEVDEVMKDPSKYYIVCYWKDEYYNAGHIPGAIHYVPKKSLGRTTQLSTLPVDKPILVYCNSGNHSSTVSAYLRILGYDAYSLYYGSNSFMYDVMTEKTGHTFTEEQIMNYPLEKQKTQNSEEPSEAKKTAPKGGC